MRVWTHVMAHHSVTADGKVIENTAAIRRYHMNWRFQGKTLTVEEAQKLVSQGVHGVTPPDVDIGYHYTIEYVDGVAKVIDGRSLELNGAHCREGKMNHSALGICILGNYNLPDEKREPAGSGPPEDDKIVALGKLLVRLHNEGRWVPPATTVDEMLSFVVMHRDYAFHPYPPSPGQAPYKLCPGSAWDARDSLRRLVEKFYV